MERDIVTKRCVGCKEREADLTRLEYSPLTGSALHRLQIKMASRERDRKVSTKDLVRKGDRVITKRQLHSEWEEERKDMNWLEVALATKAARLERKANRKLVLDLLS